MPHHPTFPSGRVSPSVAITVGIILLIAVVVITYLKLGPSTAPVPQPTITATSTSSPTSVLQSETPPTVEPVPVSRITSVRSPQEAAKIQRALILELFSRLPKIAAETNPATIKESLQDLADRFQALDQIVEQEQLARPGPGSVHLGDHDDLERVYAIWSVNPQLAETVDQLFKDRHLLPNGNLHEMLTSWVDDNP